MRHRSKPSADLEVEKVRFREMAILSGIPSNEETLSQKFKARRGLFVGLPLLFLLMILWLTYHPLDPPFALRSPCFTMEAEGISNKTLGFEKIFVLALPERTDRVQPLLAAANATDLEVTVVDAVKDVQVANASRPIHWKDEAHKSGELGCLMSHQMTWERMLQENVASAVVLESDADWDLRIHSILEPFPDAIAALTDFTSWPSLYARDDRPPSAEEPYGLNWDILWFGHCGSNAEGASRIYSWNDSSVPPKEKQFIFDIGLLSNQYVPGTRAIYQFGRTTCSTGNAITKRGAQRLIDLFKNVDSNLDLALSQACTKNPDLVCLGVWPQVFTNVVTASNIDHSGRGDTPFPTANQATAGIPNGGPAIQFSARSNAKAVLEGLDISEYAAQWDTMWAPGEYEEEKKDGIGARDWVLVPLNKTEALRR